MKAFSFFLAIRVAIWPRCHTLGDYFESMLQSGAAL